jgi:hypothetical protein
LDKIYFCEFSFNDIKEYVFPALREVRDMEELYEILFNAIKSYSEKTKENLILSIYEKGVIKNEETLHFSDENHYDPTVIEFVSFNKKSEVYKELVNKLYEAHQLMELLALDVGKIISLYLEHFVERIDGVKKRKKNIKKMKFCIKK